MIPNDQPLRKETLQRMLSYLDDKLQTETDAMSKWEQEFIVSVIDQFEKKGDLSNKQCEIVEKIYDKES